MKKVSVIIVSYNVRSYLAHGIDSVLKSNYAKLEIIVVDNHSYDGTCDYLKKIIKILICSTLFQIVRMLDLVKLNQALKLQLVNT